MAIAGVTTGINSGLPIGDLVTAMVDAERAPKTAQLDRLSKSTETKFSALGTLSGALNTFQTALKDLNSAALFEKRTATSSNKDALTATAGKTAVAGSYKVEVMSLASASKVATAVVDGAFTSGSAPSTLRVQLGADDDGVEVNIAADSDLASIREQLNTQLADKGITANILTDPATGSSRLVFSGSETGQGKDIIVSAAAGSPLEGLAVDGRGALGENPASTSAGYITQASNATFKIDGLTLSSASNTVDSAIEDVSFDLKAVTEAGKPLTLTVGQDNTAVKDTVKKFVDAYNALIKTSNTLTNVTSVGDDGAPVVGGLVGDSTVRNMLSRVRNELVAPNTQGGNFRMLADLGITTQQDGTLAINDDQLDTALKNNFDDLAKLFTGDQGLMNRLDGKISGYIGADGIIQQRQDSLQATRSDITKQREDLDRRVESMQARMLAQFNAMDSLVGQLNGTSSQLESALASLPGMTSRNRN